MSSKLNVNSTFPVLKRSGFITIGRLPHGDNLLQLHLLGTCVLELVTGPSTPPVSPTWRPTIALIFALLFSHNNGNEHTSKEK